MAQVLQHSWTYKPLVHDAFSMDLNRITIEEPNLLPGAPPSKKSFEVGDDDFFWQANGRSQFPQVAAESDRELSQYKQACALTKRFSCQMKATILFPILLCRSKPPGPEFIVNLAGIIPPPSLSLPSGVKFGTIILAFTLFTV